MTARIHDLRPHIEANVEAVCTYLLPNGKRRGAEYVVGSVAGEAGASLSVRLTGAKAGVWADFAADQCGDLIDLWAAVRGRTLAEALVEIAEWLGVKDELSRRRETRTNLPALPRRMNPTAPIRDAWEADPEYTAVMPVPVKNAESCLGKRHPDFGRPDTYYRYESAEGRLMFAIARWDATANRGKEVRPLSFDGTLWRWKRPHVMVPWNLPGLYARRDVPVCLVEGEKAAVAAVDLLPGYVVTTHHGGASQPHLTHWGHLAGRDVTLWPDDDAAGVENWAPRLAQILRYLHCRVRVASPAALWHEVAA